MHVPGCWAAAPGMALLRLNPQPRVQVCVLALPCPPAPGLTLGRRGLAPPWDLLSAPFLCMTLYAVSMLQKKKKNMKTRKKLNKTTRSGQQRPLQAERSVPAQGPVAASPCSGLCAAVFCPHEVRSPLEGWRGGGVTPSPGYGGGAFPGPSWVSFGMGLAKPFGPELSEVSRSQATQGQARSPGCRPGERLPRPPVESWSVPGLCPRHSLCCPGLGWAPGLLRAQRTSQEGPGIPLP